MRVARHASLPLWLAAAAFTAGVALRLWPLRGVATDYDEGVDWQSLRAMADGHSLFAEIFSSQPPAFLASIFPVYMAFGQSLAAARLAIVAFSLAGVAATYLIGRAIGGRWVGLAALTLLAFDPLYLKESYTLQAEMPALAFGLVAVALALAAAGRAGWRRRWLAAGAGLALALGIGAKLFDVVFAVPIALYLLRPLGSILVDSSARLRWPGQTQVGLALRLLAPDLLACTAGGLVGLLLVLAPFVDRWWELYDQVVRFHIVAGDLHGHDPAKNLRELMSLRGELALQVAGTCLAARALARRMWSALPLVLWTGASLILLLAHQPLFAHHVVLLVPPLVLLAAVVALHSAPCAREGGRSQRRMWVLVTVVGLWGAAASLTKAHRHAALPDGPAVVAKALTRITQPGTLVVADAQYVAALADRDVPPNLVDTSFVRIASGYLTGEQLRAAVEQEEVSAIVFYSGRFDRVPGLRRWVEARYERFATFGMGRTIYVKPASRPRPLDRQTTAQEPKPEPGPKGM